ncbi:hypothetical protein [Segniliparus rugosus]|uniref:Uncharacterized protein n=1 Tax=Segniliparus rugosus (strain ATCC BAA-974 / DSM 45345 / CCUG 50838 / CIP 108380 / JCM 13579 / CDC 945) TaxID=679197 RepID=E5XNL3_SEGRC|nr:hypothetical protein [Segniliparus rugosus]EFV14063.2 hypothetical protein HMPREF9336_01084 [Segniliparus rugosus ATCC BAA-974]
MRRRVRAFAAFMTLGAAALVPQPAARADPLPDCAEFKLWAAEAAQKAAGCRSNAADGSGRSFVAHFPTEPGGTGTVEVFDRAGSKLHDIREQYAVSIATPSWQDLDVDGTQELLVVMQTSASNETVAVWRSHGPDGRLVRAGALFGVQLEPFSQRKGLVFIRIHVSCCEGVYQLYRFAEQDELAKVAEADWSAKSESDYRCEPKPVPGGLGLEETRSLLCARRK